VFLARDGFSLITLTYNLLERNKIIVHSITGGSLVDLNAKDFMLALHKTLSFTSLFFYFTALQSDVSDQNRKQLTEFHFASDFTTATLKVPKARLHS
jgi:hypothetical protein